MMIKLEVSNEQLLKIERMHIDSLKNKVEERIENQIEEYYLDKEYVDFMEYLCKNIENILIGKNDKLRKMINEIETKYFITDRKIELILKQRKNLKSGYSKDERVEYLKKFSVENKISKYITSNEVYNSVRSFQTFIDKLKARMKEWRERIKKIFDYDEFTQNHTGWGAYKFVSELNVQVCPYCNRQFINTFEKKNKRLRATLDHFYAKSLYPYLALSMYNLIPSCYYCNSSLNGDEDFYTSEAIYPYEEQFSDNANFITDCEDEDYKYLLGLSSDFDIKIMVKEDIDQKVKDKIYRSIEVFALDDVYKLHKDYIRDLLRLVYINSGDRINEIYKKYSKIFKSREDVVQAVFLNYFEEDDLGKRVLSKLTRDICKQHKIKI